MNFVYFLILGLLVFLSILLGGKKYRSTALYALAIGGVVNANFFHSGNYPIYCFGLPFGIDSLIYTLFIFCILVMLLQEGKEQAYILSISSIIAIIFSAIMQLVADLLSTNGSETMWTTFLSFVVSSIASLIAIFLMIEIVYKLKDKLNVYLLLTIGIIVATIINSGIYYPISILISGVPDNIGVLLLTSFFGKLIALALSLLTYFSITLLDKKIENKNKLSADSKTQK